MQVFNPISEVLSALLEFFSFFGKYFPSTYHYSTDKARKKAGFAKWSLKLPTHCKL
jgi:hypothetical protein